VVWFSWPTFVSLHGRWTDFGYSHGYVVALLSAMLAYREMRKGAFGAARMSPAALALLALVAGGILAAHAASVTLAAELLLPMFWLSALLAVAGPATARRFLVPLAFLYFAIPIWDLLNGLLQGLTVAVVSSWIRVVGVPAFIEGNGSLSRMLVPCSRDARA
jgi:exosortase